MNRTICCLFLLFSWASLFSQNSIDTFRLINADTHIISVSLSNDKYALRAQYVQVLLLDGSMNVKGSSKYIIPASGNLNINLGSLGFSDNTTAIIYSVCKNQPVKDFFVYNSIISADCVKYSVSPSYKPSVYQESGQLLKNYYNKVLFDFSAGQSSARMIYAKNQHGQIVAKGKADVNGLVPIDIPLFDNDNYKIETDDGRLLYELSATDSAIAKTVGFALRASVAEKSLFVEMRRAIEEKRDVAFLKVLMNETLLFESEAKFRLDTNVVETSISLESLPNALLELQLSDEYGSVLASRWVSVGDTREPINNSNIEFPFLLADSTRINEYLIAARKTEIDAKVFPSFNVQFFAPALKKKPIGYQIQLKDGSIEEIGEAQVDTNGFFTIKDLQFTGKASISFYGKDLTALSGISSRPDTIPSVFVTQLNDLKLKLDELQSRYDPKKIVDSILVGESSVDIVGKSKTRIEVLEEKYIGSNMFREPFSVSLDLENDPYIANYNVYDYLLKHIPGLSVQADAQNQSARNFRYRQGIVEVYLDEIYIGQVADLPFKYLLDIGYIRFIKKPVSSSRNTAGGGLLRGGSSIGGVTATLLLYTRKTGDAVTGKLFQSNRFDIMGFAVD